jgi:coenzyme PQQ precursor peptide PqqA
MAAAAWASYSGFQRRTPVALAGRASGPSGALCPSCSRRAFMTWETPAAIDLRFGFEITMYIANR